MIRKSNPLPPYVIELDGGITTIGVAEYNLLSVQVVPKDYATTTGTIELKYSLSGNASDAVAYTPAIKPNMTTREVVSGVDIRDYNYVHIVTTADSGKHAEVHITLIDSETDISFTEPVAIAAGDSPSIDAFARLRVSDPFTIFDSKQLYDKSPLFWDEEITTGAGTPVSTHSTSDAATTMTVDDTGDIIARQTFMRFNYQPGKSQLILMTGVMGAEVASVKKRIGYFNGNATATPAAGHNGLFFEQDGTSGMYVVERKNGTDTRTAQASWNLDPMDGTGPSGVTLDFTKTQIFLIDFEWLGVGRVRYGFVVDGIPIYCHEANHANIGTSVYMSSPNLPLRYEISSTGGAGSLVHICASVASEGGIEGTGVIRSASTAATHVDANSTSVVYAVVGLRLKTTHLDTTVVPISMTMLAETQDAYEWSVYLNPTVAGTFTYADETNSAVQTAKGATANTVTGGILVASGYASTASGTAAVVDSPLRLGAAIDGTRDELVLCVRTLGSNSDIQGSLTWRELL